MSVTLVPFLTLSLTIHAVRPLLYSLRSLLAPYSRFAAYGVMGMVRE